MTDIQKLTLMAQTLFDKKGFNILVLDVRGVSTLTDYFIIAEGNVDIHVRSLGTAVMETMEAKGCLAYHKEGGAVCDWLVIDFGDIFVHLFTPECREKYRIENLYTESKIIDVKIEGSKRA